MQEGALGGAAVDEVATRPVVVIQPVRVLQERDVVAFETRLLDRTAGAPLTAADLVALAEAAAVGSPAQVLLPLELGVLLQADPATVAAAYRTAGVDVRDVIVAMPAADLATPGDAHRLAARWRSHGFGIALDGIDDASAALALVGATRPNFGILDPALTPMVVADDVFSAAITGFVAFMTTLGARTVARGVDDGPTAGRLLATGLWLGIGRLLGGPMTLDARAQRDDLPLVEPGWFREQPVRIVAAHGSAYSQPIATVHALQVGGEQIGERRLAQVLSETARSLQQEHDPQRIVDLIGDLIQRILPGNRVAIFEADREAHRLVPRYVAGEDAEAMATMSVPLESGVTGWVLGRGQPYRCDDLNSHPRAGVVPGSERNDESLIAVPMIAGDHTLGILDVWRTGIAAFDDSDLEHATLFCYIAAAAWRNAQLYRELEARAMTDPLTGLLNARWLFEVGAREVSQTLRSGATLAVLLVDLDRFKQVNDRAGHAAGDLCLKQVARALRGAVRAGDAVVRLGGEEFVVMLRDCDERGAMRVAEAARQALRALPAPASGLHHVTASIGVAVFPTHASTLDAAIRAADLAMYRAKEAGRDRIELAGAAAEHTAAEPAGSGEH